MVALSMGARKGGSGQVYALRDAVVVLKWGPWGSRGLYWGRWLCWVLIWTVNGYALVVIRQDPWSASWTRTTRRVRLPLWSQTGEGSSSDVFTSCIDPGRWSNTTQGGGPVLQQQRGAGGGVHTSIISHPRGSCWWVAPHAHPSPVISISKRPRMTKIASRDNLGRAGPPRSRKVTARTSPRPRPE